MGPAQGPAEPCSGRRSGRATMRGLRTLAAALAWIRPYRRAALLAWAEAHAYRADALATAVLSGLRSR